VAESFETKSRVDWVRDLVGVVEKQETRSDHEREQPRDDDDDDNDRY